MAEAAPKSVGLGGDGDEIAAIADVECAFGVKLDYADAPHWVTAGDVFASLQQALPIAERNQADLWKRFAVALSGETGVNPDDIVRDSPLLAPSIWMQLANASAMAWLVALLALLALIAVAVI